MRYASAATDLGSSQATGPPGRRCAVPGRFCHRLPPAYSPEQSKINAVLTDRVKHSVFAREDLSALPHLCKNSFGAAPKLVKQRKPDARKQSQKRGQRH